eukprot:314756_1
MSTKFQSLFGNIFTVVSFLIIILWSIIGVKYMFLKYFNPSKYHQLKNIEPPSPYLLNYIHLFDVLTWIFNIYIVILSYGVYDYADKVCNYNMDETPFNWKEICLKTSLCDIYNDECVFNISIHYIWISIDVGICIAVLAALFYICKILSEDNFEDNFFYTCRCCAEDNLLLTNYVIDTSHFICLICFRKTIWNHHYLNRKFFPILPSKCKILLWHNIWGKYMLLFIPLLILYIGYNDAHFGVEWYDVFPMLFVWILNEIIKRQYRKLPPYDMYCHIQYVINSVYGKSLGAVIWLFLKDDQEILETHTDHKISMERHTSIEKTERHQQISTEKETEIERLL